MLSVVDDGSRRVGERNVEKEDRRTEGQRGRRTEGQKDRGTKVAKWLTRRCRYGICTLMVGEVRMRTKARVTTSGRIEGKGKGIIVEVVG